MNNKICFAVNDHVIEISLDHAGKMLTPFLRDEVHLKGSKIVCAEGDCGACAVLIDATGSGDYAAINGCILPLLLVQGSHVVTVEGLAEKYPQHPLREELMASLGSQCGFCTPGFMVTLSGLYEKACQAKHSPSAETVKTACSGHLCRCTGYQDILTGAMKALEQRADLDSLAEVFSRTRKRLFTKEIEDSFSFSGKAIFALPRSPEQACRWKSEYPELKIIGGATDVGVDANKKEETHQKWMSLKNIKELSIIEKKDNGCFEIGANVTLTELRRAIKNDHPEFSKFLVTFASPNIRHRGTLVGNLVTASPIGDCLPYFVMMEARVRITSVRGVREIPMSQFLKGYRQTDLKTDEIVAAVILPARTLSNRYHLFKASKREHMDISTVSVALRGRQEEGILTELACVFGGMAGTVERLHKFEQLLVGRSLKDLVTSEMPISEFYQPLSDHRGSGWYRRIVAENILRQFLMELMEKGKNQDMQGSRL